MEHPHPVSFSMFVCGWFSFIIWITARNQESERESACTLRSFLFCCICWGVEPAVLVACAGNLPPARRLRCGLWDSQPHPPSVDHPPTSLSAPAVFSSAVRWPIQNYWAQPLYKLGPKHAAKAPYWCLRLRAQTVCSQEQRPLLSSASSLYSRAWVRGQFCSWFQLPVEEGR